MRIIWGICEVKGYNCCKSALITAARAVNRIYKQVLTMLNSHAVRSLNRYKLQQTQGITLCY